MNRWDNDDAIDRWVDESYKAEKENCDNSYERVTHHLQRGVDLSEAIRKTQQEVHHE